MEVVNSVDVEENEELEVGFGEEIPKVGMVLDSEEKLHTFYNKYAYEVEFGVRKISTKMKGGVRYYSLACSRGGKYISKASSSKVRLSTKTDCQAKIYVIVHSSGKCTISCVHLDHNHALTPKKSRYQRSHKKMDSYSKRRLELNDCAGIPLNKNFHSLIVEAKGYENLQFGEKDCRNYIAKMRQLRLGVGDAEALRNYFICVQRRNSNFFYVIDMDNDGRLRMFFGQMQGLGQLMTHLEMLYHLTVLI